MYKFFGYLFKIENIQLNLPDSFIRNIAMPIGLSFYIFQDYSYLIDVSEGKYNPEKNIVNFMLYSVFYAKFISGPIERNNRFRSNLDKIGEVRFWDFQRIGYAFLCILFGIYMKIALSTRLEVFVNTIWDNLETQDPIWLIIGAILYSIQIYTDFAGYTYLAIGTAKLYGIDLTWNFMAPYLETGISEFWRKWHISLSSFLKDYVYIPLGGNRKGLFRKALNTAIVFLVCGIWHGNGFQFLIWGVLHGIFSIFEVVVKPKVSFLFKGIIGWFITFTEVTFAWIFFRAESVQEATNYIQKMFLYRGTTLQEFLQGGEGIGLTLLEMKVTIVLILLILVHDIVIKIKKKQLIEILLSKNIIIISFVMYVIVILTVIFGIYGPGLQMKDFIYMQF